jgi:hypothetical protein
MGWIYDHEQFQSCVFWSPEEVLKAAQAHQACGNKDFERPLQPLRVAKLEQILLAHDHRPFDWALADVPSDGLTIRVNGQHSSKMFLGLTSEAWAQVQFPIVINRSHYTCDTRQDMPALFRHFDQAWQTRNTRDNIGAYISVNDQLHGKVDGDITTTLSRGLVFHEKRLLGIKSGAERRFAVISEPRYHAVLCWGSQALSPTRHPDMLLPTVVAAMAHTMMGGDERVMTFWQSVAIGPAHSDVDSPEHKLCRFLENVRQYKRCDWPTQYLALFPRGQRRPTDADIFATCLRAVSAYLHDRKVGDIYFSAKKRNLSELAQELYPLRQSSND